MPTCYPYSFRAMGSPCTLHLYAGSAAQADRVAGVMQQEILRLEQKYSRYRDDSVTSAINATANRGDTIAVDTETAALLDYADTLWQQSDGLFDITSGLMRQAWPFHLKERFDIPSQALLDKLLQHVGWHHIKLEGNNVHFQRDGMELDLGGIVKEYAADCAASTLLAQGIRHGLINLGGDIKAIGPHPDGAPWEVKIRRPTETNSTASSMLLYDEGLATSGDYERCILLNGKRFSHILSPKTGWPVIGLASVTVKAPQCVIAGSAATIAMLKGKQGRTWLAGLGVEYRAIDRD